MITPQTNITKKNPFCDKIYPIDHQYIKNKFSPRLKFAEPCSYIKMDYVGDFYHFYNKRRQLSINHPKLKKIIPYEFHLTQSTHNRNINYTQMIELYKNPHSILKIKKPSDSDWIIAISRNSSLIGHNKNPSFNLVLWSMKNNCMPHQIHYKFSNDEIFNIIKNYDYFFPYIKGKMKEFDKNHDYISKNKMNILSSRHYKIPKNNLKDACVYLMKEHHKKESIYHKTCFYYLFEKLIKDTNLSSECLWVIQSYDIERVRLHKNYNKNYAKNILKSIYE